MRLASAVGNGLLAAAALICAAPAIAQDSAEQRAFSPEDDLDCAIYIGALMAESEAEMTPESRVALSSAFTYFVGRYEAQRGLALNIALAQRFPTYAERNPADIEQICSVRARGLGMRLQDSSRAVADAQSQYQTSAQDEPEASE